MTRFALGLSLAFSAITLMAAEDGFVPLFNGRDLTGWVNVNCAPETWSVRDAVIYCTGKPTGAMRTSRQYENFILELEWRHLTSGGNSGVFLWGTPIAAPGVPFLRGIEVQVLDHGYNARGKGERYTTHGDVFPIHGATMQPFGRHNGQRSFPSEERSKPSPEWNQYRIVCTDGVIRLSVNGKEVSGGENCNYRKGYLALESEDAPVEFRNIRIKELPSSGASADLTAPLDQRWRSLFTGLDLRGWTTNSASAARWQVRNERITLNEGPANQEAGLWIEPHFGDVELIVDCRLRERAPNEPSAVPALVFRRGTGQARAVPLAGARPGQYVRFYVRVKDEQIVVSTEGKEPQKLAAPGAPGPNQLGLSPTGGPAEFMNLFVRDL